MTHEISDTDIRAEVRSHMARHRIDMQRAQLRIANGIVRMCGSIFHLGGNLQPVGLSVLESLERDVIGTLGVRHTFFEFDNWRRLETGKWEAVQDVQGDSEEEDSEGYVHRFVQPIPLADLLQVMPRARAA